VRWNIIALGCLNGLLGTTPASLLISGILCTRESADQK